MGCTCNEVWITGTKNFILEIGKNIFSCKKQNKKKLTISASLPWNFPLPPVVWPSYKTTPLVLSQSSLWGMSACEGLQRCLCLSSWLSSIIYWTVWQVAALPGLCLLLPISERLCEHNQSSCAKIEEDYFTFSPRAAPQRCRPNMQQMLMFDCFNQQR